MMMMVGHSSSERSKVNEKMCVCDTPVEKSLVVDVAILGDGCEQVGNLPPWDLLHSHLLLHDLAPHVDSHLHSIKGGVRGRLVWSGVACKQASWCGGTSPVLLRSAAQNFRYRGA